MAMETQDDSLDLAYLKQLALGFVKNVSWQLRDPCLASERANIVIYLRNQPARRPTNAQSMITTTPLQARRNRLPTIMDSVVPWWTT